jgi:parallel beta-helix repeat protein
MGFLVATSLVWLIIRTGRKPSRITYPCQRAAVANIHIFLLVLFAPILDFKKIKTALPHMLNSRLTKTVLMLGSLLLAFGSVAFTSNYTLPATNAVPVPLNLKAQNALATVQSSNRFFVENASGVDGDMDAAVSALFELMENNELFFFKTTSQPSGLIGKDDVVLIKVNCQWPQRGGTSTDLVRSIIDKIVNHPEGFIGEIVVADNGQGRGSLDWQENNGFNHSQSVEDVVNLFLSHRVSTWLWDTVRTKAVGEYEKGDFNDGYVVSPTEDPITHLRVSYPKFKTKHNTYISFNNGIWSNTTSSYDTEKLKVANIPVLKSNSSYGVTACVKHYMGVVSQSLTDAHYRIADGGMGTEMAETRFPTLNILDAVWVNANPKGSSNCGPSTSYEAASFTDVIGASLDPVALDYWASKNILVPAAIYEGYTSYSSLDPDYAQITSGLTESYHNYLERSMNELKNAGYQATMNETEMNVFVSTTLAKVHNFDTGLTYASIQAAIGTDETLDGHTIFVEAGIYYEHVVVSKSLTLIGEDKINTVIDGGGNDKVVMVIRNNTEISGFTIQKAGITPYATMPPDSGIYLNSSNNIITDNIIVNNGDWGIWLESYSTNNTIADNNISNNWRGCMLTNSTGNNLIGNDITNNDQDGVSLWDSSRNIISDNNISNNLNGIVFTSSHNNNVTQNTITSNSRGISLDQSYSNKLYHNNFLNSTEAQVYLFTVAGTNSWDDNYPSGGNYWNDHNLTDKNKDKIGDTPYALDEDNVDRCPLIYPYEFYLPGYAPEPDINNDGIVNIVDIATAAKAFWSVPGDARWNPLADMDMDETINILDISKVAKEFGKKTNNVTTE